MLDYALYYDYCFDNMSHSNDFLSHSQDFMSHSNDFIDILIVMGVSVFSLICSTLFVSNCVYKKMINGFVEIYNSNTTLYDYDPYFYKFLEDYDLLEKRAPSIYYLNSLGNKYIKETTPFGIVILNYNNEYNSFDYYCKKTTIVGFNYLEVVSRIYVVNYDCKSIYSDNYDNLFMLYNNKYNITNNDDSSIKEQEKEKEDEKEKEKENNDNIFFSKKYNSSKKVDSYHFVSNKYRYKGTLDDFNNYIKNSNLTIIGEDIERDNCSSFFSLEKNPLLTDLDNLNISFKTFKSLDKVKTL